MSNLTLNLPRSANPYVVTAWADDLPRSGRIGHNTYVSTFTDPERGHAIAVRYHATTIATIYPQRGSIRLNSGGYRTTTTKHRLNLLGRIFGFSVRQSDFVWYLSDQSGERVFFDNILSLGSRRCPIGCECGA